MTVAMLMENTLIAAAMQKAARRGSRGPSRELSPGQGEEEEDAAAAVVASEEDAQGGRATDRRTIPPDALRALSSRVEANLISLKEYKDADLADLLLRKGRRGPDQAHNRRRARGGEEGRRGGHRRPFEDAFLLGDQVVRGGARTRDRSGYSSRRRGLLRPVSLSEADLVLVPLVAWDMAGGTTRVRRGLLRQGAGTDRGRAPHQGRPRPRVPARRRMYQSRARRPPST